MACPCTGRQSGSGLPQPAAFLDAYQFTLVVAAVVVVAGIPVALYALRSRPATPDEPQAAAPATVGSSN
ncbi:hypothetical protein [Nonomuraea candida]|uniref:hypothetical protein n=1 Tax=Nonomuraea candida TaxID=359159 RepID=UPI0005BE80CD|nr:hypothetical protein [Nonomuraea candida]